MNESSIDVRPYRMDQGYKRHEIMNAEDAASPPIEPGNVKVTANVPFRIHIRFFIIFLPARYLYSSKLLLWKRGDSYVTFTLPASELAYWDVVKNAFTVEPGMYSVMIGKSSTDIQLAGTLKVVK